MERMKGGVDITSVDNVVNEKMRRRIKCSSGEDIF